MTVWSLVVFIALCADANPPAISATLEALRSQAAADPAAPKSREGSSTRAGKFFDQTFDIQTLAPVDYVALDEPAPQDRSAPAKNTSQLSKPEHDAPVSSPDQADPIGETDYYFVAKKPVDGVNLYTPVKGTGTTTPAESSSSRYASYGKYAIIAGLALAIAGVAIGGTPLIALAVAGGLLIAAGFLLSVLFDKK